MEANPHRFLNVMQRGTYIAPTGIPILRNRSPFLVIQENWAFSLSMTPGVISTTHVLGRDTIASTFSRASGTRWPCCRSCRLLRGQAPGHTRPQPTRTSRRGAREGDRASPNFSIGCSRAWANSFFLQRSRILYPGQPGWRIAHVISGGSTSETQVTDERFWPLG